MFILEYEFANYGTSFTGSAGTASGAFFGSAGTAAGAFSGSAGTAGKKQSRHSK